MFVCCGLGICSCCKERRTPKFLLLGIANAGKSSLYNYIVMGCAGETIPTIGYQRSTIQSKINKKVIQPIEVIDLGGQDASRKIWHQQYEGTDAVIFVVDSEDDKLFVTVNREISGIFSSEVAEKYLSGKPLLLLANKQDRKNALRVDELAMELDCLSGLMLERPVGMFPTSIIDGTGVDKAMTWLSQQLQPKLGKEFWLPDSLVDDTLKSLHRKKCCLKFGKIFSEYLCCCLSPCLDSKNVTILLVGFDAAGKTTILYRLKLRETVNTFPTIGFNVEDIKYNNITFRIWDVGGQEKIRALWRHYYANSTAIIWVVDSTDEKRLTAKGDAKSVKDELHEMLLEDELKDVILLILANKQDLPNSKSTSELTDILELNRILVPWHIQKTCALTGEGLYEGLWWLCETLKMDRVTQIDALSKQIQRLETRKRHQDRINLSTHLQGLKIPSQDSTTYADRISKGGYTKLQELKNTRSEDLVDNFGLSKPHANLLIKSLNPSLQLGQTISAPSLAGFKYDIFLSHCQASGGDQAKVLCMLLENNGLSVWNDQKKSLDITEDGMKNGIAESAFFLLFLSKGVFSRPFCRMEISEALNLNKEFILVHETDERHGKFDFGEYEVPDEFQEITNDILKSYDSWPFQRADYLEKAMLLRILERVRKFKGPPSKRNTRNTVACWSIAESAATDPRFLDL